MTYDMNRVIVKQYKNQLPTVWDFCQKENTPHQDIDRAMVNKINQVKQYEQMAAAFAEGSDGHKEYTRKAFQEALAIYQIMTFEEFHEAQKQFICKSPIVEVTEEDYWEHLEVLPPEYYGTLEGVTMFCMGERTTGTFTAQYAKYNGRYFCATVDVTDRNTWIYNRLDELPEVKEQ